MKGISRRMTAAFRRDSRASMADVVLDTTSALASSSRPTTPDINEPSSAPAPKETVEPAVVADAHVAEPEQLAAQVETPAAAPEPAPAPAPEPQVESTPAVEEARAEPEEVQPAAGAVAIEEPAALVAEPERHTYVLLAFKYTRRARKTAIPSEEPVAVVEEPESLEDTHAVEATPAIEEIQTHEDEEHDAPAETESPAFSMPVPELHHQSSDSYV